LSQVEIRNIEGQEVEAHVIGKMTIGTVHPAQIVKITSLAKDLGLVRVVEENRRLADEIDKPV
jgi:uncharacterized protein YunC (DUF1805 family)